MYLSFMMLQSVMPDDALIGSWRRSSHNLWIKRLRRASTLSEILQVRKASASFNIWWVVSISQAFHFGEFRFKHRSHGVHNKTFPTAGSFDVIVIEIWTNRRFLFWGYIIGSCWFCHCYQRGLVVWIWSYFGIELWPRRNYCKLFKHAPDFICSCILVGQVGCLGRTPLGKCPLAL